MRAIAEFAMRGQTYAIATSMIAAALPLLGWLSVVIVALVCLRHGALAGSMVLLWTSLPVGIAFYLVGDPSSAVVLASTFALALLLRQTVSWELVLVASIPLAAIGALLFDWLASGLLDGFAETYLEYIAQVDAAVQLTAEQARSILLGFLALGHAFAMLVWLIVARWCQSALYNPGGFGKEFRSLRLSPAVSAGLLIAMLVCFMFREQFGIWLPLLTVPLVFAAIALVHWLMKVNELSKRWAVAFYATLVLLFQLAYPFLASMALMDSWFNIRNRVQTNEKD